MCLSKTPLGLSRRIPSCINHVIWGKKPFSRQAPFIPSTKDSSGAARASTNDALRVYLHARPPQWGGTGKANAIYTRCFWSSVKLVLQTFLAMELSKCSMILVLVSMSQLCTAESEERSRRTSFQIQLNDACIYLTQRSFANGATDYWSLYYYLANITLGTGCNPRALINSITQLYFFTPNARSDLLQSPSAFPTLCSTACYGVAKLFVQSCFTSYDSASLISMINGMCSVNNNQVACYDVTSMISTNPSQCYDTSDTAAQCTQACRYSLLRFSYDAGCCAQSVYNTDYLHYLFYMDSGIWGNCGLTLPTSQCTTQTSDPLALYSSANRGSGAVLLVGISTVIALWLLRQF